MIAQLGCCSLHMAFGAARKNNVCTLFDQTFCARQTNTTARAGNQNGLVFKAFHGFPPRFYVYSMTKSTKYLGIQRSF